MTEIIEDLYLGDKTDASNIDTDVVLNVSEYKIKNKNAFVIDLPMEDDPDFNISKYFDWCNYLIDCIINKLNKSVLVNCRMGISRSATIVCSYLCYKYGFNTDDAIAFVRRKRDIIEPNPGFVRQLKRRYG